MAPSSENKPGDNGDDDDITPYASREMSALSLPSIGETYEGALIDNGIIEGPIVIGDNGRRRSLSIDSTSNFSIDSDDMSHMTSDSKKRRSRRTRNRKSSKSKRKGSSSGPSYAEVDIDTANRILEEKDIVVSSLVKQVEELQQQLLENNKTGDDADVTSEQDVAEELIKAKRLLVEKEVVAESLIEQAKIRQNQLNEKTSVIEEQSREITRLKAKLAFSEAHNEEEEEKDPMEQHRSNSARPDSAGTLTDADVKSPKSRSKSKAVGGEGDKPAEKRESKNKKKKRSSKQGSSRKMKDVGEVTPTKSKKTL